MDLLTQVERDTGAAFHYHATSDDNGRELVGPCPLCGGTDRFSVWPEHPSGKARFKCWDKARDGCGIHGDAIQYFRDVHRMDFAEAKRAAGMDGIAYEKPSARQQAQRKAPELKPPGEVWQARARAFVAYAQEQLWKGGPALEYLRCARQLADETIRKWGLGYNPQAWYQEPDVWGVESDKKVCMAPGIVIPCEIGDALWYVQVRCPYEKEDGMWDLLAAYLDFVFKWKDSRGRDVSPKYYAVKGGTGQALFGGDDLHGDGRPLLLCEGEFDTMLAWQEIGEMVDACTLGGAGKGSGGLPAPWMLRMLPYEHILVAYDVDTSGNRGADELLKQSKRAVRAKVPRGSDLTDFVLRGGDLQAWIAFVLAGLES